MARGTVGVRFDQGSCRIPPIEDQRFSESDSPVIAKTPQGDRLTDINRIMITVHCYLPWTYQPASH